VRKSHCEHSEAIWLKYFGLLLRKTILVIALMGLFTIMSTTVRAASLEDLAEEDKTVITSDGGLHLDYARQMAVFRKNVVVEDHRGIMRAEEIRILFEPNGSKINTITALGNVQIEQEGRVAEGQKALIKSAQNVIELTGNPKIKQGKDIYSAEKITIYSKRNEVVFEPKARLVIYQQSGEDRNYF
jgi:lipopolysaccharide transport protein LptA